MNKAGKNTIVLKNKPKIICTASVVGEMEAQGNLGEYFDSMVTAERFGTKSFEQAESKMQKQVVSRQMILILFIIPIIRFE